MLKNIFNKKFISIFLFAQSFNVMAQMMPMQQIPMGNMPGGIPNSQMGISPQIMKMLEEKDEIPAKDMAEIKQQPILTLGEALDLEGKITRYRLEEALKKEKGETQNNLLKEKMQELENLLTNAFNTNNLPTITSIRGLENDLKVFLNYQGKTYTLKKNENIANWKVISIFKDYIILKDLKTQKQHKIYFGQQNSFNNNSLQQNYAKLLKNENYKKLVSDIENLIRTQTQNLGMNNNSQQETVISNLKVPDIVEQTK